MGQQNLAISGLGQCAMPFRKVWSKTHSGKMSPLQSERQNGTAGLITYSILIALKRPAINTPSSATLKS